MDWQTIVAVVSLIFGAGGFGGWYLQYRKSQPEIKVLSSQEKNNLADAANVAAGALISVLNAQQTERTDYYTRVDNLETRLDDSEKEITQLKANREERDRQIAKLKTQNEVLESEVRNLSARIIREGIESKELHEKYQQLKNFTNNLIDALKRKGIDLPELNGGIPDSISGYRVQK